MKCKIVLLLLSIGYMTSCSKNWSGIYTNELNSGIKHISSTSLVLTSNNHFKLVQSTTSLEFQIPSTQISIQKGKYQKHKKQLYLLTETKQINWVSYGENPDTLKLNPKGVRKTALIAIDTSYGKIQLIKEPQTIKFNLTNKSNSIYIWNDQNCFCKFKNTETSNDLKNYCSEIYKSIKD